MEIRVLGRTGLEVGVLGLGGAFLSRSDDDGAEARRAIRRALELGVNYIDTAPRYGDSEALLGEALVDVDQPYYLATKLGGRPVPFDPRNKDALRSSVVESLRLLRRDRVDLLMIHEPDRPRENDWWSNDESFQGPVDDVISELRAEGVIDYTGLGGTTAYEMAHLCATERYDVVLTAFNYSLLWREAEISLFPAAKKSRMGIVCGSPLQQGTFARRYDGEVAHGARWLSPPRRAQFQQLYALLDEIDMGLPEIALRFVISNPDVSTTLMGARSVDEVEANVEAVAKGPLPTEILERLQAIADLVPFRPYEEPAGPSSLPFGRAYRGPGPATRSDR